MAYCTFADIVDLMSIDGVDGAANDLSANDPANTVMIDNAIERAEVRMNQFIARKYDTPALSNSNKWVKWSCATLASLEIYRRRGSAAGVGLVDRANEVLDHLKDIRDGKAEIPDQAPRHEPGMTMTNIRIDNRYRIKKSRAVTPISVGELSSKKTRHTDRLAEFYPY